MTTPDAKTIVFTLNEAHAEIPYLVSFTLSTPVPKAKDTNENYDRTFVSSGPYKTKEYIPDTRLVMEKNTELGPELGPDPAPVRRHRSRSSSAWTKTRRPTG